MIPMLGTPVSTEYTHLDAALYIKKNFLVHLLPDWAQHPLL